MFPSIVMMRFGRKRRVWIPFPFIILWPLIAIGCVVTAAVGKGPVGRSGGFLSRLKIVFSIFYHISGLRIDVKSHEGDNFYLRMI